jgi:ferritin-like metal-binding protein YciE
MPIVTLRDLYVAELQDLFDTEQQLLLELPAMAASATSSVLRDAFDRHRDQTRVHAERLELLLRSRDAVHDGHRCDAIRGLIGDGRRRIASAERGIVLDAALIGVAQRIEHYEIAAYRSAQAYARALGDHDAEKLLQQTLDEERAADARLTRMAERGAADAAGDGDQPRTGESDRLRYVTAAHLREEASMV